MKLALKVAVSFGLLALLFVLLPWHAVQEAVLRIDPLIWAGVLGGSLLAQAVGIMKWRFFVNVGRAGLKRLDAVHCYSAGLFANLCLPGIVGGDLLRLGLAGRFTGRAEAALWGGVSDRATDVLALGALAVVGSLLSGHGLTGWASQVVPVLLVIALILLLVAGPLLFRRPLARWPRRFRRTIGRSLVTLRRMRRQPKVAARGFVLSLGIQSAYIVLQAWLGRSVGIDVTIWAWFFAWPLVKLIALLPISLGGLAVREASLAALLLGFGVPPARSVVASLLWQAVVIFHGLLGGLVWLALSRARHMSASLDLPSPVARHG